jgi:hypothetical protein
MLAATRKGLGRMPTAQQNTGRLQGLNNFLEVKELENNLLDGSWTELGDTEVKGEHRSPGTNLFELAGQEK